MSDHAVGALLWFTTGWGIYTGSDPFASGPGSDFYSLKTGVEYARILNQFGFAVTSSTIVSGAVLSRLRLPIYLLFAAFLAGFTYPVVAHWVWNSNGWLAKRGFRDFAGSGVVHLFGGSCALIACLLCGPRVGRFVELKYMNDYSEHGGTFGKRGKNTLKSSESEGSENSEHGSEENLAEYLHAKCGYTNGKRLKLFYLLTGDFEKFHQKKVRQIVGHSAPLKAAGGSLLYIAWFAFNASSSTGIATTTFQSQATRAAVNTMLASGVSALTVILWIILRRQDWDLDFLIDGVIAGLVAVTAPCGFVDPWAAIILGFIAVFVYRVSALMLLQLFHVDDPLNAISVHATAGLLGVIYLGFVDIEKGLFYTGDFYFLGVQLLGGAVIFLWAITTTFLFFYPVKFFRPDMLIYSEDEQVVGLDFVHMGGTAFPDFDTTSVAEFNASKRIKEDMQNKRRGKATREGSEGALGTNFRISTNMGGSNRGSFTGSLEAIGEIKSSPTHGPSSVAQPPPLQVCF